MRVDQKCMTGFHVDCPAEKGEGECACVCHTDEYVEIGPTDMFGNDLTKTDSFGTPRERTYVACSLCGRMTAMATKLCDRCWELRTRVENDPDLARKILDGMGHA